MLRAALRRFVADPRDPLLRTHTLKGDLDAYWAFTADDELRVLFRCRSRRVRPERSHAKTLVVLID